MIAKFLPHLNRILFCIVFYLGGLDSGFSEDLLPGRYLRDSTQLPELFRILLETEIILECLQSSKFYSLIALGYPEIFVEIELGWWWRFENLSCPCFFPHRRFLQFLFYSPVPIIYD